MDADKNIRILRLYNMLMRGEMLRKQELAEKFNVTPKSIQRDIENLRDFFELSGESRNLVYDAKARAYVLRTSETLSLTNSEVLAVAKILLESRSMVREEMFPILDKLVRCCTPPESLAQVQDLLKNEKFHYQAPHHGKRFIELLWTLGTAIEKKQVLDILYFRTHKNDKVMRRIHPVGLLFSEYYFYLAAFIEGLEHKRTFDNPPEKFPAIFRVDKIDRLTITDDHFHIPYRDRFEEGEMRKRIQFMYAGKLQTVHFIYTGPSLEAVLDRLPTARVEEETKDGWVISAEVYGKGIDMWLRSQGDYVKRLDCQ